VIQHLASVYLESMLLKHSHVSKVSFVGEGTETNVLPAQAIKIALRSLLLWQAMVVRTLKE
jgi:hypothetical protein